MEALPHDGYLEFRRDTLEVVRRGVGLHRPGEMADAVRILHDWVKQQKHFLKKNIDLVYLETLIVMSKGYLERAKCVLDKMCTARTLAPNYFDPYDVEKEYQIIKGTSFIVSLPKLTEEYHRLMVWKFIGRSFPPRIVEGVYKIVFSEKPPLLHQATQIFFNVPEYFQPVTFQSLEYHKRWDYHGGGALIYDLSQVDLGHVITTLDLIELKNVYMIIFEAYGFRIKRIHIITPSKLVYTLINFFKQFLKKKIVDRVMVHESWAALQQYYPKNVLPKDYGGTERSLDELQEDFLSRLSSAECQEYFKELSEMRVDEDQRPVSSADNVISRGTFRALNID